jgi:hypothetical protein
MRSEDRLRISDSPVRSARHRSRASRIIVIAICLTLLAVGACLPSGFFASVSAAVQQAAKRVTAPAAKPAKPGAPAPRQSQPAQVVGKGKVNADGSATADQLITDFPIERTTADIMTDQANRPAQQGKRMVKPEFEHDRQDLPSAPGALAAAQWPLADTNAPATQQGAPQTLGTQLDGATGPTETGAFPPDTMGAVGPTQFFVFLNGRMRTFNKTTGVADGVVNADPDVFFASVITPPGAGEVSFTSDPQVRFDRLTNRWFLVIIDVVLNASTNATTKANRVLIAVCDAASNGTISAGTVWTLYQFQGDATLFTDYESLGIDASALYIGGDMFSLAGAFNSTKGFVIPKAPALTASPLTVWAFSGLVATPTGAGPFAPRGVDNYNPNNTGATAEGYFIGVDNATFNTLMLRRVTNPGSLGPAPTITANLSIATPLTTRFPVLVPHLGNTGGTNGRLDSLDDRLYAAHIRNGRLWTAHSIGVNNTGVAGATNNRNAARWYELQNVISPGTPAVLQSGTVFDNNATNDANQRNYWIPSIMVSGQGHAALGCSIAGTNERVNAFTTGRLVGDTLGALRDGPGGAALPGYTASATAYNPPGDPGGPSRRWGDYSFTSLDPKDDMTMWTVQEYCNGTNTYGPRAVKLIAPPPPPTNTASPGGIQLNNPSTNLVVTGVAPAGQGFYDPGANPPAPHTPFTHISATGAGIIVNSITFNTPTQVTLNVSTVGSTPGSKTITLTNPDGQTTTVQVLVGPTAAKVTSFQADGFDDGQTLLQWNTSYEIDNLGYNVYREVNGQRTKITPQLIAGSALITGQRVALSSGRSYAWSDLPGSKGGTVRYWLEDIDLSGKSTLTGPVSITPHLGKAPTADQSQLLAQLGQSQGQLLNGQGSVPVERRAQIASVTAAGLQTQAGLANGNAFKIGVKSEGWYRISQSDLIAAGLGGSTNPRLLQLFVDGQEVPMIVNGETDGRFDGNDSVEFYGLGLDSLTTNEHVYWLTVGTSNGQRIKPIQGTGGAAAPAGFQTTVERQDRTLYFSGLINGDKENFFGPVISGTGVTQTLNLSNLATPAGGAASLDVAVQGVTYAAHQVQVLLNGNALGTINFSGQALGTQTFSLSQSALSEGANNVRLVALGGGADISLVGTLRITYWHKYAADSNQLRCTVQGGQRVALTGFTSTSIRVMDVTNPNSPQELLGTLSGGKGTPVLTLTVPGTSARTLYAFASEQAKLGTLKKNIPSNWRQAGLSADYVMITRGDLTASLNPLATYRRGQGYNVVVVDVEDLFDEFSFGNRSPQALRDFLSFTKTNWGPAPRFVLMGGDGTYDYKNYLGFGDNDVVPSKLIDTVYMETASDDWYVDFNDDGLPEMAIGRLPVRNATEASRMVAKIISYDSQSVANSVLLVSDSNDGYDFSGGNNSLRPLIPSATSVSEILRGTADDATVHGQLIAALNSGQKVVNYSGHGSINLWRGNLLTNDDAKSLTNGQSLELFVVMNCLNAYFIDPALDSLGERLLRADRGGACAVWASSGQCEPLEQTALNQEFYRQLFGATPATVGEAAARAKSAVANSDIRRTWTLLGDPAMRLR